MDKRQAWGDAVAALAVTGFSKSTEGSPGNLRGLIVCAVGTNHKSPWSLSVFRVLQMGDMTGLLER